MVKKMIIITKLIIFQDIIRLIIQDNLGKKHGKNGSFVKVCAYCSGKNHILTHCDTMTHIETRKNISKKGSICFSCLSKVHLKK